MDILDVNEYLNAASDALQDDPEYFHWIQALGDARKQALDECNCCTDKVEGCLWQIYARQVAYILEHKDEIEKRIQNSDIPDDDFNQDDVFLETIYNRNFQPEP